MMREKKFAIHHEQRALGNQCRVLGITRFAIAEMLKAHPSTVAGWLGGYNVMPNEYRALILHRLQSASRVDAQQAGGAR